MNHSYIEAMESTLKRCGFHKVNQLSDRCDPAIFGNAEVTFQSGTILFKFIKDQGQDFLEIASIYKSDRFFQVNDLFVAMGWWSLKDLNAKQQPSITDILSEINKNAAIILEIFSLSNIENTVKKIQKVEMKRETVFIEKLKNLASKNIDDHGHKI